jgi:4-hydroxy-2-oxoheptanedioate aldolase
MMTLKYRLGRGETVLGTWCVLPSGDAVEAICRAGMDFAIIDLEHGPHSFETAANMARAAQVAGASALVRVPANRQELVLRALEIGSDGVMVPQIEDAIAAELAVKSIKYFPEGQRGFSPFTRSGGFSAHQVENLAQRKNAETLCVVLVEGVSGIQQLDAILVTPGIDVIYIGTYDLCQSAGHPGQPDHPEVLSLLESCVRKIVESGKAAGCLAQSVEQANEWQQMGIAFIALKADVALLSDTVRAAVEEFRG